MIALIDADVILYRAAWKHEGDDFWDCVESIDAMFDYIFFRTGSEEYIAFFTGKDNFRKELAFTKEYKGNRKGRPKPALFDAAREYMTNAWGCVTVNGIEADDALGICQTEMDDDTIICTIDKDLQQIEGVHYNWNSDEIFEVSKEEAIYTKYIQILMGDSTDNIQGIPRVGEVKAIKILSKVKDEGCSYLEAVCDAYVAHFEDEDLALDMMNETAGLTDIATSSKDERFVKNFIIPPTSMIF
jgi:5'-3' exonuclease